MDDIRRVRPGFLSALMPAISIIVLLATVVGVLLLAGCGQVSAQDIRGMLQAMEGKEMVITLEDGTRVRVTVDNAQAAAQAQQLVGQTVNVKVRVEDGGRRRSLENVSRIGEDQHFTGVIQTIGAEQWIIGGRTFKVDANTRLDGGLAIGVTARVEFVTLADGSALATEIETDADDDKFRGAVQSMGADAWVIGGQTFKVSPATRIDQGIAVGATVRVEFTVQPDGSMLATEIETDQAQDKFHGIIESIGAEQWVIGGRTFKVNAATRLDDGLIVGARARVEFITLADGSMLATEIETDEAQERFSGTVESMSATSWVVGGRTFKVSATTRIDRAVVVGMRAKVRFLAQPDGAMLATRIQEDRSGPSRQDDLTGTVESITATSWVVGGKTFKVSAATRIDQGLAAGAKVRVRFSTLADGSMLATRIEAERGGSGDRGRGEGEDRGRGEGERRGG